MRNRALAIQELENTNWSEVKSKGETVLLQPASRKMIKGCNDDPFLPVLIAATVPVLYNDVLVKIIREN